MVWRSLVPGTVVAAVGAFDAAFNGNLLFRSLYATPLDYPSGGTLVMHASSLVLGIDAFAPA